MTKLKISITAASVFLLCAAFADEASTLTKMMQTGMNEYATAAKAKNVTKCNSLIKSVFASDCKFISIDGKSWTMKQWTDQMNMQLKSMKSITSIKMTISNVKVTGKSATSKESFKMVGVVPSPAGAGKTSKLEVIGTSTSTYAKRNGKWWVIKSKDTSQKILIDGKQMTQPVG